MIVATILTCAIFGGFIQGLTGFGAGVLMTTFSVHILGMYTAPALSSAICISFTAITTWRYRRSVHLRKIIPYILPYSMASVWAVNHIRGFDLHILTILFGLFLMALSAYYLTPLKAENINFGFFSGLAISAFSGLSSGMFGIGGPLMALFYLTKEKSREEYTANLQCFFFITSIATLLSRIVNGIYTADMLPLTIAGAVAVNVGGYIGNQAGEKLNANRVKKIIYFFIGILGVFTVWGEL